VDALLVEKGVTVRPDGGRTWRLKNGEIDVGVLREAGQVVATELRVPLSDRRELINELVAEASSLATAAEARLVDPQLGRAVGFGDSESIAEQYVRTARYAGEMSGVSEAVAASFPNPAETPTFRPGTKILLVIGAVIFLLYFLMDALNGQLAGE
jgi:hypothetical protein